MKPYDWLRMASRKASGSIALDVPLSKKP